MSLTAPQNTLAYQLHSRPLARPRSVAAVPAAAMADRMDKFIPDAGFVKPEHEAIWFYTMAHAMREVAMAYDPHEPLPPAILNLVEEYNAKATQIAVRALYYLTIITAREARHLPNHGKDIVHAACKEAGLHPNVITAMSHYTDTADYTKTTKVMREYLKDAPITDMVESLRLNFYKGKYGGGFGGKAWGKVTDCLLSFVKGETSAEVMLDTVWTLAHNNGPIFNKGFLYNHQDNTALLEILDLQRAGQLPRLMYVGSGIHAASWVTEPHRLYVKKVAGLLPKSEDFQAMAIDWGRVVQLGAVGTHYSKYTGSISAPKASHSPIKPTPYTPPKPKPPAAPQLPPEAYFQISPMMKVEKKPRPKKVA